MLLIKEVLSRPLSGISPTTAQTLDVLVYCWCSGWYGRFTQSLLGGGSGRPAYGHGEIAAKMKNASTRKAKMKTETQLKTFFY